MNNNLIKSIFAGLLLGAALFVMPFFLIRLVLFAVFIGALFRFFGGRRNGFRGGWGRGRGLGYRPAFANQIRQMSDDEYTQFKQQHNRGNCGADASRKSTENTNTTNKQA